MLNLRAVREARGWTLNDLAVATGLNAAYLSRAERGERSLSTEARVRLARALNLTPKDAAAVPELGREAAIRMPEVVPSERVIAFLASLGVDFTDEGGAA